MWSGDQSRSFRKYMRGLWRTSRLPIRTKWRSCPSEWSINKTNCYTYPSILSSKPKGCSQCDSSDSCIHYVSVYIIHKGIQCFDPYLLPSPSSSLSPPKRSSRNSLLKRDQRGKLPLSWKGRISSPLMLSSLTIIWLMNVNRSSKQRSNSGIFQRERHTIICTGKK